MKNTKELKRFRFSDDARKYANNVNDILTDIGESLDKLAFTKYDHKTCDYVVSLIFGQHPGTED